jgi:D-3-phosphoglycerate dehydrogenase
MKTIPSPRRKRVLLTDHPWDDLEIELTIFEKAGLELVVGPKAAGSQKAIEQLVADYDPAAILTCWAPVSDAAISAPTKLEIVARLGVGLDNIDVAAATKRQAWVSNVPDYCVPEVSDHAVALLLTHFRRVAVYDHVAKTQGKWAIDQAAPERIGDLCVGILGFGRIGQATANKLKAFGCRLLAHSPSLKQAPAGIEMASLQRIQQEADVIVLHLPLSDGTHHLVNDGFIQACRRRPFLINVGRGGLIDNNALLQGLSSSRLRGAALDVVEGEPHPPQEILSHPNILITPHIAFLSVTSLRELRRRACEDVVRALSGETPLHPCNEPTSTEAPEDLRFAGGVASDIRLVQGENGPYVVKQALEKLRVAAEWLSDPARSSIEVMALRAIAELLGQDVVPEVLWTDTANNAFAMRLIDARMRNWKQDLLSGHFDDRTARRAGELLGQLHKRSSEKAGLRNSFEDLSYFHTLRVEPYFKRIAQKNPSIAAAVQGVIAGMEQRRTALVHGDYSPKNLLVDGDEVVMLDCEVAHWGDPRFDLAFGLSHLWLKSCRHGCPASAIHELGQAFIEGYRSAGPAIFDAPLVQIFGCLVLARLDGDSPVDYLDQLDQGDVRAAAIEMISNPLSTIETYFRISKENSL